MSAVRDRRSRVILAVVLLAVLAIAGCSDDSGRSTSTTSAGSSNATEEAPTGTMVLLNEIVECDMTADDEPIPADGGGILPMCPDAEGQAPVEPGPYDPSDSIGDVDYCQHQYDASGGATGGPDDDNCTNFATSPYNTHNGGVPSSP